MKPYSSNMRAHGFPNQEESWDVFWGRMKPLLHNLESVTVMGADADEVRTNPAIVMLAMQLPIPDIEDAPAAA